MVMLTGYEVDDLLKWPKGRADRMARRGQLPHIILPDGKTIRFNQSDIEGMLKRVPAKERE